MANTTVKLNASTRLALDRTRLAYERTLMAWVRTATSLITFGFTIYKFFEYLAEAGQIQVTGRIGPRQFAVGMMALGIAALQIATFEHRRDMRILYKEYGVKQKSLATKLAAVMSVIGGVALMLVIFRQ